MSIYKILIWRIANPLVYGGRRRGNSNNNNCSKGFPHGTVSNRAKSHTTTTTTGVQHNRWNSTISNEGKQGGGGYFCMVLTFHIIVRLYTSVMKSQACYRLNLIFEKLNGICKLYTAHHEQLQHTQLLLVLNMMFAETRKLASPALPMNITQVLLFVKRLYIIYIYVSDGGQ